MEPTRLHTLPPDELSRFLKALSYRQREVLKLISGVGDGFRYTPKEVASIFRVSEAHINLIVKRAMSTLDRRLEAAQDQNAAQTLDVSGLLVSITMPEFGDDQFITDKLVELYEALNNMHVGAGGSGLIVDDAQSCAATITLHGAPVQ